MKTMRIVLGIITWALTAMTVAAADPTATNYSYTDCLGSAMPYAVPTEIATYPDSLTAVFINHVGRHGSRFPASAANSTDLAATLQQADSVGVLSPLGKSLLTLTKGVIGLSRNRWGALDSLGMAEQRGIASRMFRTYPKLFASGTVNAISSYAPRCVMSMYEFTHQLDRLNNTSAIYTSAGRQNSTLMRPFDAASDYTEWVDSKEWQAPYDMYFATSALAAPARRLVTDATYFSNSDAQELAWMEYKLLSGLPAMGLTVDMKQYFTTEEINALWSCQNLRHYLLRSATTLSEEPALIAADLLLDLINSTDEAIAGGKTTVNLRFGHAETLLPLLALLRAPGCYYMTNYFDTVAMHWRDFAIVPMSANLQMVLFRVNKGGSYCVRFELNEQPIALIPGSDQIYIPWEKARAYMVHCLPLQLQP